MTYFSLRNIPYMRPMIALILIAMGISGCFATRLTPPATTVKTLRTIAIVPVESPPLTLYPDSNADRAAISRSGLKSRSHHSAIDPAGIMLVYIFVFLPIQASIQAYASSVPRTGEVARMTEEPSPPWMPTIGLGKKAAELLQRPGMREAFVVEGYARLPIEDRTRNDNSDTSAFRRFYNSDVSTIDYGARGLPQADAILEVVVSNYSYLYSGLGLDVMVKLTDPLTRRVLGRARNWDYTKGESIARMLQNEGQPLKQLIESAGERLLIKCLQDLGL